MVLTDHSKSSNSIKFNVPDNINKHEFDYKNSEFLECNGQMATGNQQQSYQQNSALNFNVSQDLSYLSEYLTSKYKHYWLSGGTLLGKFSRSFSW